MSVIWLRCGRYLGAEALESWKAAVARLDPDRPPEQRPMPVLPQRWRQFVVDANKFINGPWAARAAELDWDAICLFGVIPGRIFWRDTPAGLVSMLNGGMILELGHDRAVIVATEPGSGCCRPTWCALPRHRESLRQSQPALPWELHHD